MSYEYHLDAPQTLTAGQLAAVRRWFREVTRAAVHTDDGLTWYLFNDEAERARRVEKWRQTPPANDHLTSFIVVTDAGAVLSLVEDDVDAVAADFATWWLKEIGGRLSDEGEVISPAELLRGW